MNTPSWMRDAAAGQWHNPDWPMYPRRQFWKWLLRPFKRRRPTEKEAMRSFLLAHHIATASERRG